jgi:hypothetical protein
MRPGLRLLSVAVGVGIGLGTLSTLGDGIVGGRLVGILGNMAAPWGLGAFVVGREATSLKRGAAVGALTLVTGVATYYVVAATRGYVVGSVDLVWTAVALVAGPVMGSSGAAVTSRPDRAPIVAVVAPSAMLVAEAVFQAIDRRAWRWNLVAEPYRLIDLGVMVALFLGGFALAAWLVRDPCRRAATLVAVLTAGILGAGGLVLLRGLIVRIA